MSTTASGEEWLRPVGADPEAPIRLICFPYAGGGGSLFRVWAAQFAQIEVCVVQLPGRGIRSREAPQSNLAAMVPFIAEAVQRLQQPCAFFGHSMGALMAFEVARHLRREAGAEPVHLFVSGREAPHVAGSSTPSHRLPDDELIATLRELNGTPPEVLEDAGLMRLMLPAVRADLAMVEMYNYSIDSPLACPITAFGGTHDSSVRPDKLEAWRDQTTARFERRMIEGDHFFVQQRPATLVRCVSDALRAYTG